MSRNRGHIMSLHPSHSLSLQIEYRKGSKEKQAQFSLSSDMMNMSHAKKAQALASDLDYRKKLHDYTVMPDDIKVQQAKKAYALQSEVGKWRNMGKVWLLCDSTAPIIFHPF